MRYPSALLLPRPHPLALALALVLGHLAWSAHAADTAPGADIAPGADSAPPSAYDALPGGGNAAANTYAIAPSPGDDSDIDSAYFDPALLRQRCFDPQIAEYLKRAPRFMPGVHQVSLIVNGTKRGKAMATFDAHGKLCFDAAFADAAGLVVPSAFATGACHDLATMHPTSVVELHPEIGEIALVVPMDAVRPADRVAPGFARGGSGALLNYEVFGSQSQFGNLDSDHLIANTEVGLNAGNWIVRSAQSYSDSNGVSNFERRHTYAERALLQMRSNLQVGDITLENSVLPGALITGVQIVPESGLSAGAEGVIAGIAQTQARVDVRQSGALIYSAVVPPGPFQLSNLALIDRVSTVDVTVTEADGSERRFSVPAASLDTVATAEPTGYTATVGRVRDQSQTLQQEPWVASASGTWAVKQRGTVSAGAMGAQSYAAAGVGGQARWEDWGTYLNGQLSYSNASRQDANGTQVNASVQQRVSKTFSLNASALQRTKGYRDLLESTQLDAGASSRTKSSWSVGAGWGSQHLGNLGVAYSRTSTFENVDYARGTMSWGKQLRDATLSASAEWDLDDAGEKENGLYFTVTVPLGTPARRLSAGYNQRADRDRYYTRFEDRPTDTLRYRVNAERDVQDGETDVRADVSLLPRYTQLDLGYSRGSGGDTTSSYGLRGGIVAHRSGITFSPYPIDDSFGILKLGQVPGVKVQTPAGPVWTDWKGQAVIPQLQPYRTNAIELVAKTLPRNVNVANGRHELEVGRGSVQHVAFDVSRARRVLLLATMLDGSPVPAGASVIDTRKKLVTMVTDGGEIFLTNDPVGERLGVHMPDGAECTLEFALPESPDPNEYYETVQATCRPGKINQKELAISQLTAAP